MLAKQTLVMSQKTLHNKLHNIQANTTKTYIAKTLTRRSPTTVDLLRFWLNLPIFCQPNLKTIKLIDRLVMPRKTSCDDSSPLNTMLRKRAKPKSRRRFYFIDQQYACGRRGWSRRSIFRHEGQIFAVITVMWNIVSLQNEISFECIFFFVSFY